MRSWSGVMSLAVGIFVLITIEELPIGVLSVMSAELGIPEGVAGLAVTVPGLVAAATSVTTPVLVRGLDRRLVLFLALLCVAASSLLTVLAPGFAVVLAARVLAGVSIGLYWAVLPIVAVGQVDPSRHATALTLAFSGTGGALVLGVPLATWIGTHLGWREAFAVVGAAALVMAVLVAVLVRPVRAAVPVTPAMMREAARGRGVRHAVGLTLLLIVAQFVTYSYVSPLLQAAGVPLGRTGLLLLLFGIAGMIGNVAIAPVIRRRGAPTAVLVIAAGLTLSLLAVALLLRSPLAATLLLPAWGALRGGRLRHHPVLRGLRGGRARRGGHGAEQRGLQRLDRARRGARRDPPGDRGPRRHARRLGAPRRRGHRAHRPLPRPARGPHGLEHPEARRGSGVRRPFRHLGARDPRRRWPVAEPVHERRDRRGRSLDVGLDGPVEQVPHRPRDTEALRLLRGRPAEADALHPAVHPHDPAQGVLPAHRSDLTGCPRPCPGSRSRRRRRPTARR